MGKLHGNPGSRPPGGVASLALLPMTQNRSVVRSRILLIKTLTSWRSQSGLVLLERIPNGWWEGEKARVPGSVFRPLRSGVGWHFPGTKPSRARTHIPAKRQKANGSWGLRKDSKVSENPGLYRSLARQVAQASASQFLSL